MDSKSILVILVVIIISYYLQLNWLVIFFSIVLFFIGLASIKTAPSKPKTVEVKKNPDVIYPVIYEDVGKPPMLYPEKMAIKIHPDTKYYSSAWEDALKGIGAGAKAIIKLFIGKKKEKK